MTTGPCAKLQVTCVLHFLDGGSVVGRNDCRNPQEVCPRQPGDDYTKCRTICDQLGHAEQVAADLAGPRLDGAFAEIFNHTYACRECQERLFSGGCISLRVYGKGSQP